MIFPASFSFSSPFPVFFCAVFADHGTIPATGFPLNAKGAFQMNGQTEQQAGTSPATRIVAIDGPVGTGKSSVAKQVAKELGYAFLDTGAMYRAATWRALHHNIDLDDGAALAESARLMDLDLRDTETGQAVRVDGEEVTKAIRESRVTNLIYKLDQNPEVRAHLVALQRRFGEKQPTVAEGRDIGTVVFPNAKCKIYLDADLEERSRRRAAQLEKAGVSVDRDRLREAIRDRDQKSMTRAVSPLRKADDAVLVDTTEMTFDEVVREIVRLARERL
jgi:CMP/dCMP kinase